MAKVRILSGNQAGAVVELPQVEAECAIDSGYAVAVADVPAPRLAPKAPPKPLKPQNRDSERSRG